MKAVPAYERSLDPADTDEVPKPFQIPKLGELCINNKSDWHSSCVSNPDKYHFVWSESISGYESGNL